jgi:hypothetical protein
MPNTITDYDDSTLPLGFDFSALTFVFDLNYESCHRWSIDVAAAITPPHP